MYIKSIVLDGFKSYGNRVEVTGFDPEFNAITGLNGTGKSNILDSICFVLGITNLSNVRAGSLQELIYKHGQAGITKATVSITFDNRDKKQSPISYENHDEITVTRQVVMGGKNKYLINGINVQNKRVSDLFCSVQLNVNNPHFLIMQGRITKVLNMKPPEILSMVEEAAGTRMYEAKKQAAQKTIEKKDAKLRELNDIIKEDIAPKLQKLQDERSQFQEYQKVVRELENLSRLYVAWKYVSAEENAKEAEGKVTEVQDEIKSKKQTIKNNEKEAKDLDKQVADLNKKLDEESGSILQQLESELQGLEKTEATLGSSLSSAKEAVAAHEKKARLLDRALADDDAALAAKKNQLQQVSSTFESLRAASEASEAALAAAQQQFLAISSGLEGGGGASASLQDQLMGNVTLQAASGACGQQAALAAQQQQFLAVSSGLEGGGGASASLQDQLMGNVTLQAASGACGQQAALAAQQQQFLAVSSGLEGGGGASASLQDQLMGNVTLQAASGACGQQAALAAQQQQFLAVSSGLEGGGGASASLQDQLMGNVTLQAASGACGQQAALAAQQQQFLAVSSGLEGGGGASASLQDQLMEAKQEASEASTRITQSTMEKKHAEDRLKALEKEFKSSSAQFQKDQDNIGRHQAQVDQLKAELSRMNFSEERNAQLKEQTRSLQSDMRRRRDAVDSASARLQRCHFQYSAPQPNFDHRRVCGTVCRLINVCDPVYCTALETAAGGRLYNVVVDTEVTSKLLLQKGNLQTRTTIIPLNKISGHVIDKRTVKLAQDIGGGPENVQLALDLISYEQHLHPAMAWVFGNTLVCRDLDTAKKVTFHPQIKRRCVTLDGDVFDPSGTLSGGARVKGGSVLVQIQELKEMEQQLQAAEAQLSQCTAELSQMQGAAEKYSSLQNKYEMMSHELEVIKARLATTTHAQLHAEIEALRQQVKDLTAAVEQDKAKQQETAARAKELEAKVRDIKGHREREFKKAEETLKKAKKQAEQHSSAWKNREQEFETLRLEVSELEAAVTGSRQQLVETKEAANELQNSLTQAKEAHAVAVNEVKQMQARIKKQKSEIAGRSTDIARLAQKKEQLFKANNELELAIKELDYKIKELQTEATDCEKRIKSLEAEHPWIPSERQYFGAAGGLYDWQARQAQHAGARLAQLQARRDKLARGLNARAHTLLGKEEEQYQDVMRKKKIVEADRAKLVEVMAELDEKKKKTLVAACEQVNKDFGSIFSTLLPGAQAKLRPPEGLTVLDGLEVKVGFNNTWKESLGELSGGQRSLVALSLVLAMLLFKPAPLYILDEVDAALDLSHTQNIGHMLKEHFKHSQFIIVSLKDGMFNNANVLFRTKFVDGMSSVQRTVNPKR